MLTKSIDIEIIPLAKEHMEAAAALVMARYQEGRKLNPLWPDKYHRTDDMVPVFCHREEERVGVAAVRCGKVAGFITSIPYDSYGLPVVWIPEWAHGAEASERGYLYRRMYTALADYWVARGRLKHGIKAFAHEQDVMDALFATGFGMNGMDAMRGISALPGPHTKIKIRRANAHDTGVLMELLRLLAGHLRVSPVFAYFPATRIEAGLEEFQKQLEDEKTAIFLAYEGTEIIGFMRAGFPSLEEFNMPAYDEKTCAISIAYTREAWRGKGVAAALLSRVLAWGNERGCTRCTVDFESANMPGSRFWLSHFQPVCYNLARHIEHRVYAQITGEQ
jgi:GNAT superfamily N-acetyltransferase